MPNVTEWLQPEGTADRQHKIADFYVPAVPIFVATSEVAGTAKTAISVLRICHDFRGMQFPAVRQLDGGCCHRSNLSPRAD